MITTAAPVSAAASAMAGSPCNPQTSLMTLASTCIAKLLRLPHGGIKAEEFAAIGEGIRRDIQYAHDKGSRTQ
jgi:hypothetical protein